MRRILVIAGSGSLVFYLMFLIVSPDQPLPYTDEMIAAADIMRHAIEVVREFSDQHGIEIDDLIDPNQTGLIGPELSPLTTTLGHLPAKRTTTNPNMAGLIVHLLHQAGVERGDTIAIGSSASFPALMVASLSAAKAMGLFPKTIISLGASSFGATKMNFNLLDIYNLLLDQNICAYKPIAISLGGEKDVGELFEPGVKKKLIQQIKNSGIPFIFEADLERNVNRRMNLYCGPANESPVSAFINCGGSYANLGTSSRILKLKPGLNRKFEVPPRESQGVLFRMIDRKIPTIHLLYIKGLVLKYNLPWDPLPLPDTDTADLRVSSNNSHKSFTLISGSFFVFLLALAYFYRKKFSTRAYLSNSLTPKF